MSMMTCNLCGYASKNGDKAFGRCQNALNENYARPLWSIKTCTYDIRTKTQPDWRLAKLAEAES